MALTEPLRVKLGLVPTFRDRDDSRAYRRRVVDWVMYMSDARLKDKTTFGQQFFALFINVHGNARVRVEISRAVFRFVCMNLSFSVFWMLFLAPWIRSTKMYSS